MKGLATISINVLRVTLERQLPFLADNSDNDEDAVRNAVLMKILQLVRSGSRDDNENSELHKVRCDACGTCPIRSDRYKCLTCGDLDMCGDCFESRRESTEHKSGHVFAHFKSPGEFFGETVEEDDMTYSKLRKKYTGDIHESITCDGCGSKTIKGLRHKCDTCRNYDLCQICVDKGTVTNTHKASHPLIVVGSQLIQQIPVEDIQLGDELGKGAFGRYSSIPPLNMSYQSYIFRRCAQSSLDIKKPSCCM